MSATLGEIKTKYTLEYYGEVKKIIQGMRETNYDEALKTARKGKKVLAIIPDVWTGEWMGRYLVMELSNQGELEELDYLLKMDARWYKKAGDA